jgi:hypothetical protein
VAPSTDIATLEQELQAGQTTLQEKRTLLNELRQAEQNRLREEKLNQLHQLQADAKAFRLEASQAVSESERATLRGYARDCEEQADLLRIELGLESSPLEELEPEASDTHRDWLKRQIWGNLNLSLLALTAWFFLYYVGEGTTGTLGYIAQVLAKPAFHAFMLFAGLLFVFLVIRRYFYTVTEYLNRKAAGVSFELDFRDCSAFGRLFFLLGLLYVITQFLAAIYQVTL